jgi:ATP-dependent RNA circularization protein (DNA/RNA ligase family)
MEAEFVKFPSTPHLLWLGKEPVRKDKLMSTNEAKAFLQNPVVIEEKVDGANIGISFDSSGNLMVQNRGNSLERGTRGQFIRLWAWLSQRESSLLSVLEDSLILFGEWCYAKHSIHYTRLPDLFLGFDVFNKDAQKFMNANRRDLILRNLGLTSVPFVASGVFELDDIPQLIGESSLYDGPMEGVYLRQEDANWLVMRAKVVRAEFVQQMGIHWSRQPLVSNTVRRKSPDVFGEKY